MRIDSANGRPGLSLRGAAIAPAAPWSPFAGGPSVETDVDFLVHDDVVETAGPPHGLPPFAGADGMDVVASASSARIFGRDVFSQALDDLGDSGWARDDLGDSGWARDLAVADAVMRPGQPDTPLAFSLSPVDFEERLHAVSVPLREGGSDGSDPPALSVSSGLAPSLGRDGLPVADEPAFDPRLPLFGEDGYGDVASI